MHPKDMRKDRSGSGNTATCIVWLFLVCCLFPPDGVNAQTELKDGPVTVVSETVKPGSPVWEPSSAGFGNFDWIQLTSGEWLAGNFRVLYDNDVLEFESDKLDILKIDWEDIKQVRGRKPQSVRFKGSIIVTGIVTVVDDKISILTSDGVLEFDRSRLLSITPEESKRINTWSAKVSIGLDIYKGNSEETNYNTSAQFERRHSKTRVHFDYLGILNKYNGIETANNQRVSGYYDVLLTSKYFWRPVFAEYFRDPFSNIGNRIMIGSGAGYHIIDKPDTKWDIASGLAYQHTQNVSAEAGQASESSTPALELIMLLDTEVTKRIDLNLDYRINIVNNESGTYLHHTVSTLEIELTRRLDLDISFVWDRIENPKLNEDGVQPDQDGFHLAIGIGFEL